MSDEGGETHYRDRSARTAAHLRIAAAALCAIAWTGAPAAGPPGERPSNQWETLPAESDDIAAVVERADHAAGLNMIDEADRLYRQVLQRDPEHQAAHRGLTTLWRNRTLTAESESLDAVRALLPDFTEHKSRHFVIVSDAPGHIVQQHATRLERALHEFGRFANRLDLRPLPLRHRLVCVLFNDRDDYAGFARNHDNVAADWIAGYYSPKHDRVVFYNAQSNPHVRSAQRELADRDADIRNARSQAQQVSLNGDADDARQMHRQIEQYRQQIHQHRADVEKFAEHFATATTVHETVHQLLFHTRVQSPYVEYPFWISEGLATSFETESIHISFGPNLEFESRRASFEQLLRDEQLLPLEELLTTIRPPGDDPVMVNVLYHQSYALLTWMHRSRRHELADYIRLMRAHEPGRLSAPQHLALFEQAFGDVDRLERAWLRDERAALD